MSAIQFNSAKYDKKHAKLLSKTGKKLRALYDAFYQQVAVVGSTIPHTDGELYLRDYPAAQQAMYALLQQLAMDITHVAVQGNEAAWGISNAKNSNLIASLGLNKATVDSLQGKVTKRSESALKAFQERKVNGMGLSERVWAIHKGVMPQIEMALELGLAQGRSAASLSRDVREYLNEPNKLFRRVRDKDGVLRLSKAAAAYHPGRGVYRSSYKNALRLTATESNMAYRSADHAQWGGMDFVVGITISLSGNHPVADICDELKGVYPKDFKFTGWHPFCRCFATPKLASREEMNKWARMSDAERANYEFEGTVKDMPKGFNDWMAKNAERIASAKSVPYFIKDNYVGGKVGGGLKFSVYENDNVRAGNKLTPQEIGDARHAARTQTDIDDILHRWDSRNYTPEQIQMFAEAEKAIGVKRGRPMSYEDADKQSGNPKRMEKWLVDNNGGYVWTRPDGVKINVSKNPNYNASANRPYEINCQTCAPAYMMRRWGFDITAGGNTSGSLQEYLSHGHWKECWLNNDGSKATHDSFNDWMKSKQYKAMTPKRYMEFFDEKCADKGVYELCLTWKGGGGHCTIVERFADGSLKYIEPQVDNSQGSKYEYEDISYLCNSMATRSLADRKGVMRIDNKLFNIKDYASIFEK